MARRAFTCNPRYPERRARTQPDSERLPSPGRGNNAEVSAIRETRPGAIPIAPAGPLSEAVLDLFAGLPTDPSAPAIVAAAAELVEAVPDPLGDDDLQLALYLAYELHYRSFPGTHPGWEWDPLLLGLRAELEQAFFGALDAALPAEAVDPAAVGDELFRLEAADEGPSLSRQLEASAELEQFREFVVHRSLYQLKEADPHSWAIPRLRGQAKTALLEVQYDEYGSGRAERMHSALFAKTMRELGLEDAENAYLGRIPGVTIATVNLMSGFGLHRSRRGAIIGHLAMFEMTSARPNRAYGNALRRLGLGPRATDFYDEHVEADAVHENIAAYDMAGGFAREEPEHAADVLFGARALLFLEDRFARHLLGAWERGESSLREPL